MHPTLNHVSRVRAAKDGMAYLQSHGILLYLLRALSLLVVRRLHTQPESQLGPGLYLLLMEFRNELEQREGAEALALALGGRAKGLPQGRCVHVQGYGRIAVKNEAYVRILDGPASHRPVG